MLALAALAEFMSNVDQSWRAAAADPFAEAEAAFTTITRNLEVATLEPYRDYADASGTFRTDPNANFTPDHLARRSDLAFVCGPGLLGTTGRTTIGSGVFFTEPAGQTQLYAQAGLDHLVNALGYFVEFGPDSNAPAFFAGTPRERWRLKQVVQPSESLHHGSRSSRVPRRRPRFWRRMSSRWSCGRSGQPPMPPWRRLTPMIRAPPPTRSPSRNFHPACA